MKTKHSVIQSFQFAWTGLTLFFRRERQARIELVLALAALGLCAWFKVSPVEWCLVLLCIGCVFSAEAMNTALEELADALHPKVSPAIGRAKDRAAGAVLVTALSALVVGIVIFGARLSALLTR